MKYQNEKTPISTVCFTGHRSIDYNTSILIPSVLKASIEELIKRGARRFRAGGAMGFDTIAALCVLELREQYPDIRIELVLPCREQSKYWKEPSVMVYDHILGRADSVEYVQEHYTPTCMHERNRRLVDESDVCLAFCSQSHGGTAYTFAYALESGLEVINILDFLPKNRPL